MRPKRNSADPVPAETRHALLNAAAEVFAQRGFASTTVREICQLAGANIAAVNYHFGDKETLYGEVLKHSLHCAHEKFPPDLDVAPNASPEQRLHAFVRSLLLRMCDQGRHAWHGKLISREMIEPTGALDSLVEEEIRPMAAALRGIVRELMGGSCDEDAVRLHLLSVVSQCLFYHHCRPVITRLFPDMTFAPADVEALARHITGFSLAAIKRHATASAP